MYSLLCTQIARVCDYSGEVVSHVEVRDLSLMIFAPLLHILNISILHCALIESSACSKIKRAIIATVSVSQW